MPCRLSVAAAEGVRGGSSQELVTEVVGSAARVPGAGEGAPGFFASLALEEDLPRQVMIKPSWDPRWGT